MNGWTWLGGAALLSGMALLGSMTLFGDRNSSDTVSDAISQNLTDSDMLQTNAYALNNDSIQDIERKMTTQNQEGFSLLVCYA